MEIECEGFTFTSKFDGANLAQVEYVPKVKTASNGKAPNQNAPELPDYEFNLWTKPDCAGTEFENGNRTWFYFGIKGGAPFSVIKLNIVNLNRQAKLFSEGMSPVYKVIPGKPNWERIHDKPIFSMEQKRFILSFKYRTLENLRATTYFAFTYPYSYSDLQTSLQTIDTKCGIYKKTYEDTKDLNTIYYHRECVCYSLEQRRVDLITVTSYHGITSETETRLKHLFPETEKARSQKFSDKKIVFVSARVHPGETPASFVFNGMLNYLLQPNDPVAQLLRKNFVFKFIPSLNPDGMAQGHYRTDTRGVNLNRVYLNPSLVLHPSIYAARALLRLYHYGCEMPEEDWDSLPTTESASPELPPISDIKSKVSVLSLADSDSMSSSSADTVKADSAIIKTSADSILTADESPEISADTDQVLEDNFEEREETSTEEPRESGLFVYLDLHGHASKKGVFMYGNHFEDIDERIECMLLPKIMSLNSANFHFTSCNFTKRNMYLRDRRDGMSREGSGRVAMLKLTGLKHCYTLECNYNTGRFVNTLPPSSRDPGGTSSKNSTPPIPPKYTPQLFEEVGRALAVSVLDLAGANPWSRVRSSEMKNLQGVRDWLRRYCQQDQKPPRRTSLQVSCPSGAGASTGVSSLPSTLEVRKTHLAPLKPLTTEDQEKKENLTNSSLTPEPSTSKLKSPMSPRENLSTLPSPPRCTKTKPLQTNKVAVASSSSNNGKVSKVRKNPDKLVALVTPEIKKVSSSNFGESSKSVQILKQGPKRLKISTKSVDTVLPPVIKFKEDIEAWCNNDVTAAAAGTSRQNKLVKQNRSSQLRLSPLKGNKKKSNDWEKKKGKVAVKILPISNKKTSLDEFDRSKPKSE